MKVLILAGGLGMRLRPYTTVLPKPLMPLGDKPILERLIIQLKEYNFKTVYFSVGYLSSLIRAYFGDGNKWGVQINYIQEDKRLGTAGPLSLLPEMTEPFLVLNGDLVTDMNFSKILNYHNKQKPILTIGVHELKYQLPLGFLEMNENKEIIDYIEKPIKKYNMSMGIYVCSPKILSYINKNEYLDFPDLTKTLIQAREKVSGYFNNAYWLDIGRPEEYEKALEMFEDKDEKHNR